MLVEHLRYPWRATDYVTEEDVVCEGNIHRPRPLLEMFKACRPMSHAAMPCPWEWECGALWATAKSGDPEPAYVLRKRSSI